MTFGMLSLTPMASWPAAGMYFPLVGPEKQVTFGMLSFTPMDVGGREESKAQQYVVVHSGLSHWAIDRRLLESNSRLSVESSLKALEAPSGAMTMTLPPEVESVNGASLGIAAFLAVVLGTGRVSGGKGTVNDNGVTIVFTGFVQSEKFSPFTTTLVIEPVDELVAKITSCYAMPNVVLFVPKSGIARLRKGCLAALRHERFLFANMGSRELLASGAFYTYYDYVVGVPYYHPKNEWRRLGVAVENISEVLAILQARSSIF